MAAARNNTAPAPPRPAGRAAGFTLMEMMVVIGLVALMATMALPSVMALFNAGADAQAYNLISAQLTAARALAIERSTYAGVHVQLAAEELSERRDAEDGPRLKTTACYSAIVLFHPDQNGGGVFRVHGTPRRTPGSIAYGKVVFGHSTGNTVGSSGNYTGQAGNLRKFTTFTVVFSPEGSVVRRLPGESGGMLIRFDPQDPAFQENQAVDSLDIAGQRRLWDYQDVQQGEEGVAALCIFDLGEYEGLEAAGKDPIAYLDENASAIPINVHTGLLYPRE